MWFCRQSITKRFDGQNFQIFRKNHYGENISNNAYKSKNKHFNGHEMNQFRVISREVKQRSKSKTVKVL